ncbi:CRISPR-associated endoribonuclease Cas6 [Moorella sp. Hama-1]|uniref:CRISPR-associated endoribonuclease Cas6 n=1 Tax=Moorella sp. Hama-1 TaxID=2138101 RepID=UPI001379D8E1|nr:CRISPR-associated endoribonuclease Cas6 [Moorella sp. Hama-1]BCV20514.1 CRISPR-associated endoribonuclease Cas6 [Moorella sp. Hama-1]
MLYSLVIYFSPREDLQPRHDLGASLHAFLYNLIRSGDGTYAAELHQQGGIKPFTVSPVEVVQREYMSALVPGGKAATFPRGSLCRVRFTLLQARPFFPLAEYFLHHSRPLSEPHLNGIPLEILEVKVARTPEEPGAGYSEYRQLWEQAAAARRITLEFSSPTTFRQGDVNLPLPVPRLIFAGLAAKWRHFAPDYPIHQGLDEYVDKYVAPAEFNIKSALLDYGRNRKYVGFKGRCSFIVSGSDEHKELAKQVSMLADYAFYAGIGQKTTMGMGQARRLQISGS